MKNFSDLQAISTELKFEIALVPIIDNGTPWVKVMVNDRILWEDWLKQPWQCEQMVSSLDPLLVRVEMRHKRYDLARETAVLIRTLRVQGEDLAPDHCHHARYVHDHDHSVVSHYLGFNGVWTLDTVVPFWQWRHQCQNLGWLLEPIKP